jgi:hypothetical protein
MPEATRYITDTDSTEYRAVEDAFVGEYNRRAKKISTGWDYYNGNHRKPLKAQKDGYDDNVVVNHVESLTDRIIGFLLGDGIMFDASGDDEQSQIDERIATLLDANRSAIMIENIALAGAIEGHCAVRLVPADGDLPRLIRIKQRHFSAFWDAFDMDRVLWYRLQHTSGGVGRRIDYVKGREMNGRIDHTLDGWTEYVYKLDKATDSGGGLLIQPSAKWELAQEPEVWEFDWPPITDWQNLPDPNSYYGRNDIDAAIRLNDATNFILSNTQRIIKHFADPKTVVIGAKAGQIVPTAVGGLFSIPSSDAKVMNLEMQSDGELSRWLAEVITAALWESGGMVDPQNVKDMVGQLTNFGLRVLFANAVKKTGKKRILYEEAFSEMIRHALELAGTAAPDMVATIWPDVLPTDEEREVEVLGADLDRGAISLQTYRERRGYDNERELNRLEQEGSVGGDPGVAILGLLNRNRPFNQGG